MSGHQPTMTPAAIIEHVAVAPDAPLVEHVVAETPSRIAVTPWKTVPQVAEHLQVGTRAVYRAIRRGDVRAARIGSRGDIRIHDDWTAEWMERLATPVEVQPLREVRRRA